MAVRAAEARGGESSGAEPFSFPAFYSFAPSFTRQPVASTRAKQARLWCELIRDYCRHYGIFWLDLADASATPLFHNAAIARRLSLEDIEFFVGELVSRGEGVWDAHQQRCLVFWRRPAEWGELVYRWVERCGLNGTVATVEEIRLGDDTTDEEFHGLDLELMLRALAELESAGKAKVFGGARSDHLGVKFL